MNICDLITAFTFSFVGALCPLPAELEAEEPVVPPVIEHRFEEPVPVQIFDPDIDARAEAEKADVEARLAIEAAEREKADLVAQQGMNAATQSMNEATQQMAVYSLWSTILVGIGTILLGYTLWLTRQANEAAQKAIVITQQIGEKQTQAYLSISKTRAVHSDGKGTICFEIRLNNTGQTPAYNVSCKLDVQLITSKPIKEKFECNPVYTLADVPAGAERSIPLFVNNLDRSWLASNELSFVIQPTLSFTDVFDTAHEFDGIAPTWSGQTVRLSKWQDLYNFMEGREQKT